MPVNDIIKEAEYNNIRNKVIGVLGTGAGNSGYGQTLLSTAVAPGNTVSITEWGRLRYDIINAYTHIYGSAPSPVQVVAGNTIRYSVADAPVTTYDSIANTIVANRFTAHPSQVSTEVYTPSSTTWPGVYGSTWTSKIQCLITVSWPNADAARYFFNSGGEIRITASQSGGSPTWQVDQWRSMLNTAGTRSFGGNTPGTGTSPANGQNWYRLTNSYQVWYSVFGSSPYGSNNYRISARCPVVNNSSGTASSAEFLLEFIDNYVDPGPLGPPYTDDAVDGTFTVEASSLYATGILVPTGTGNFVVTRPAVTIGAVAP